MSPRTPMLMRSFRVPARLWTDALEIATHRGDNLAEVIRAALVAYVRKHRKELNDERRLCARHGIPDCSPLLNGCVRLTADSGKAGG